MTEKNSDQNLIVEILLGSKWAEEELYRIYREKLNRLLRRKFPKNSDHEDDVSEIMIKIFESLKTYDSNKSKFNSWVTNITKNYMIDKLRKKRPLYVNFTSICGMDYSNNSSSESIGSISSSVMNEPQSTYISPHDGLEINDSLGFISNTIGFNEFSMLSLKFKDGYDYKEIGNEFKLNESQISNKVNYTKSKIKKNRDNEKN